MGEPAARITTETQKRLPSVPWAEVVGLRNRVIHGYDEVDFDILWNTVVFDFPTLAAEIERSLSEEGD